jgi:hypothetical protein
MGWWVVRARWWGVIGWGGGCKGKVVECNRMGWWVVRVRWWSVIGWGGGLLGQGGGV